jgi:hypothetical protein
VVELRQPVPHHHLLRGADTGEGVSLEGVSVDDAVGPHVELHVDDRGREVLHGA